ncbi:MAG: UDP-3-O-acyl-N-acetylglucosamine deacetylase [Candidatus Melainabacteria bacterium]|nr:UDP-3-O-acyl-N-acetylglucosamine deacetylase [Candidatus Melainabacteria bacterium]
MALPSTVLGKPLKSYQGRGITSRQDIGVSLFEAEPGTGIVFVIKNSEGAEGEKVFLPAHADYVVNTLRNVVIGQGKSRLCLVEHILCAVALGGIDDLYIEVAGPEVPLGNGSGDLWMELFESAGLKQSPPQATIELKEPIILNRKDRSLMAIPDETFSVSYLMDWKHPKIGKVWRSWTPAEGIGEILDARTFGNLAEHKMLGLENDVVSMTEDDFTMELRFPDEPVRHKLLDLVGDLMLCGVNPLKIKARFISIKGGHEMDVEMAKLLAQALKS